MNVVGKLAAGLALASLSVAQPVLAGTRASDSLPTVTSVDRVASPVKKRNAQGIGTEVAPGIFVLAVVVVAGIAYLILDNGDEVVSPGT